MARCRRCFPSSPILALTGGPPKTSARRRPLRSSPASSASTPSTSVAISAIRATSARLRRVSTPIRWPIRTASCISPAARRCTKRRFLSAASALAATASIKTMSLRRAGRSATPRRKDYEWIKSSTATSACHSRSSTAIRRANMRRLCFSIMLLLALVMLKHNLRADEPFYLGQRAIDDLPALTDDELGSDQQRALLAALGGDPYGYRGGDHAQAGCAMLIRSRA